MAGEIGGGSGVSVVDDCGTDERNDVIEPRRLVVNTATACSLATDSAYGMVWYGMV